MTVPAPDSSAAPARETRIVVVTAQPTALWVIAALLAIIAVGLVFGGTNLISGSPAMAQSGMLGARGLFAFTGQLDKTTYGLWMMDVDAGTVWCYEYNPLKGRMRLAAARSFRYDRYLEDYNQADPSPEMVQMLLQQQRQAQQRARNMGVAPPTQPPAGPANPAAMTAPGGAGS